MVLAPLMKNNTRISFLQCKMSCIPKNFRLRRFGPFSSIILMVNLYIICIARRRRAEKNDTLEGGSGKKMASDDK